jgi:acyl-CoA synthetase (AMP-forming)/AMP-acid ligase II
VVSEDETLPKTLMPLGMEGELWIGGIGVAKGYLHAPDLTKEVARLPQPQSTADCRMCILSTDRNLHHSNSLTLTLILLPLTAQKFFANPFGAGRVYRTGDIVVQMGVRTPFIRWLNSITVASIQHCLCSSSSQILCVLFSFHLNSFGPVHFSL